MFKISREEDLLASKEKITKIIQVFREQEVPKLQRYLDYYEGKQDILNKHYQDPTKPCNRIVKNYCYSIVNNYLGYLTGLPITYKSNEDIGELVDIFAANDINSADSLFLRNALVYGVAFEVAYVDEEGSARFKAIDPRECIPIYDDTLEENLLYMIRFFETSEAGSDKKEYRIEIYDSVYKNVFKSDENLKSLELLESAPHYFNQVPFAQFKLNEEEKSIFANVMSLQDAYNELLSGEVDDFQAFIDAYLVFKGTGIDEEDAKTMRENRILIMDAEDSAEYLTKNCSDTQVENMLKNINDSIHVIANSPDFNDEKFMATSGIAMRYKLTGFENTASAIVNNMTSALNKRIELIAEIIGLVNGTDCRNITVSFTRNLPVDDSELINKINSLRGLVSDRTLLSLLPFVSDVDAEIEALREQKLTNIDTFGFGLNKDDDEDDEGDGEDNNDKQDDKQDNKQDK